MNVNKFVILGCPMLFLCVSWQLPCTRSIVVKAAHRVPYEDLCPKSRPETKKHRAASRDGVIGLELKPSGRVRKFNPMVWCHVPDGKIVLSWRRIGPCLWGSWVCGPEFPHRPMLSLCHTAVILDQSPFDWFFLSENQRVHLDWWSACIASWQCFQDFVLSGILAIQWLQRANQTY